MHKPRDVSLLTYSAYIWPCNLMRHRAPLCPAPAMRGVCHRRTEGHQRWPLLTQTVMEIWGCRMTNKNCFHNRTPFHWHRAEGLCFLSPKTKYCIWCTLAVCCVLCAVCKIINLTGQWAHTYGLEGLGNRLSGCMCICTPRCSLLTMALSCK